MPDARPSPGHLCGQLYATLRALRAVGAARWKLEALRPYDKVRTSPSKFLPDLLDEAGRLLLKAHGRGNKYGAAAEELFRSIPDLLPPGAGCQDLSTAGSEPRSTRATPSR